MSLAKRYDPKEVEPRLRRFWQESGVYHFAGQSAAPVYAIDTPPPTVSGQLHLGHVYSYTHTDLIARYRRMRGDEVYYPMGYDDNGLPTERLVEKRLGLRAADIGREAFIEKCLQVSEQAEVEYQELWQRLGLSIDWRYTYRTIDAYSRRTSQRSFIDLVKRGLAYRRAAPTIWCPECRTAIAQSEVNDLERDSEYVTLRFEDLLVATTRPELLPACVAVFVHPAEARFRGLAGRQVRVPLFGQPVPVLEDFNADPQKGTGAVMCCTFGDTVDIAWWHRHRLPLVEAIGQDGRLTAVAGAYAGLPLAEARRRIKEDLAASGLLVDRTPTHQAVPVHERCDTPVEYLVSRQWFVRLLADKDRWLAAGEQVRWHPEHMRERYRTWVENLNWDWCISRQRTFGVPIPLWYCQACGEIRLADEAELPVDPLSQSPGEPCACGSPDFLPETDVMDTWATSSLTPQIAGRWLVEQPGALGDTLQPRLFERVFPFALRPQAHEIIRTWAFYTIVKSLFHFDALPWRAVLISGWGLAGEGLGKISKSRGGGPLPPLAMLERYSADALRYWAASTGPGKDSIISEEKIQQGARLVTKLWNVARFVELVTADQQFATGDHPAEAGERSPADRWILARLQQLIRRATVLFDQYDYAAAKSEVELFFWQALADNYLEMAKQRLYSGAAGQKTGATATLQRAFRTVVQLMAPFLPYVTEAIYQGLWGAEGQRAAAGADAAPSIHRTRWPEPEPDLEDASASAFGEALVAVASAARRYKSERGLALGTELARLEIRSDGALLAADWHAAEADLASITRARCIAVVERLDPQLTPLPAGDNLAIAILQ
jgi:valyl-tRNA synthetase